jgi:type IV pilus assembly protein PilM
MSAGGIDISDSTIKYVAFSDGQQGKKLRVLGEQVIPDGIVVSGSVKDVPALSRELSLVRREHQFSFVRASLPEEKAYLFQLSLPSLSSDTAIKNAIEFQLEEQVPISPQEAIFSYEFIRREDRTVRVSVVVYSRQTVSQYSEAFARAGMIPLSFEIEARAIARSLISPEDLRTYMLVDFGKTRTGVAIVSGGTVCFSSTLDVEGRSLTDAIIKHFQVTSEEAERIKNEGGFLKREYTKDLTSALLSIVGKLSGEIEKHHQYWDSRNQNGKGEGKIRKIVLSGGNANLAGLPEFLAGKLRIPVERGNVWRNAFSFEDVIPSIDREHSLAYATAIGLAL